ncbi:MAG: prolyl oligopeptidase family serine peptidase [Pseudomonadota bacterium]|nr:prolyl oligopeptidase family serine peptidase [Pseudomonadota bacterium]
MPFAPASPLLFRFDTLVALGCVMFVLDNPAAAATPATGNGIAPAIPAAAASLAYPAARRGTQTDDYHGTKVSDPYRWMEDIDSPETRSWVAAQADLSREFLDSIAGRASMTQQLKDIWNFERWTPPVRHGDNWFYTHNDGLQNQSVVFVMRDGRTGEPAGAARVLLDPNTLSADGTVALRETAISADGRLFAYALSEAGSDWQVWRVRDVATGKDLPDTLKWSKAGGGSWRKDGSGFYYTAYDPPQEGAALKAANEYEKLYWHRLGTPQSDDELVYTRTDNPGWFVAGVVTDDGRYLVIQASLGADIRNTVLVQDLTKPHAPIVPVIPAPHATYDVVDNIGTTLIVRTDDGAPRHRIIGVDLGNAAPSHWHTIIAEGSDTIDAASLVGGQLLVHRLKDAHSTVQRYSPGGKRLGDIDLPGLGTVTGLEGHADDTQVYFGYSGFGTPPSIYRVDLDDGSVNLWHAPQLKGFVPAEYETQQVFCKSRDGARVPVFITARKGTKLDGTNPTILYGYGGFNVSVTPNFSPTIAAWVQMGGVYAVANLRGGGEYGRAWHQAGMKTRKQNVFDDFIAAAEYLNSTHWTNPKRLAIRGASNGGLLIGAVEEQRPDIAAAAIAQVGVMDMLRFRQFTVGKAWESDYGTVDSAEEFRALYKYSPYHNARSGSSYPATLIMTGDHDDRVFPAHSFKFAAALQHADPHGQPILLRVETRAGHGQGMPTAKLVDEVVDIYAFVFKAFGLSR